MKQSLFVESFELEYKSCFVSKHEVNEVLAKWSLQTLHIEPLPTQLIYHFHELLRTVEIQSLDRNVIDKPAESALSVVFEAREVDDRDF